MGLSNDHVLRSQMLTPLSRRRFVALGSAVVASGLLAACGSDDDPTATTPPEPTSPPGATTAPEPTSPPDATEDPDSDPDPTDTPDDSDDPEPTATEATSETPGDDEPQHGGILFLEMESDAPSFDMHANTTSRVFRPMAPCHNLLVQFDPLDVSEIIPDLAESWTISDDGLTAVFSLIDGVTFHSGKPCISEDVKASFDRIIFPPEGMVSPRQQVFSMISEVEATDDLTVTFHLEYASASLLTNLAVGWNVIYNADVIANGDPGREVDGTGPFMLKEYVDGVHYELEKNPNYFVPDRPYLDGIRVFIIPDANTVLASFITEQLHFIDADYQYDADEAERLAGDKITIHQVNSTSNYVLEMNADRGMWGDPRVRMACSLAVDRYAAIELFTEGNGTISGPLLPGGPWAITEEELRTLPGYSEDKEADRDQARALLEEAGFPFDQEWVILTRQGAQYTDVAIFVQDQLGTVGINMVLDVNETAAYTEKLNARDYDLFGGSVSIAVDDPDDAFGQGYICGAGRNYSNYCDEELTEMFAIQSRELDPDARRALVQDMERHVIENVVKINFGFRIKHTMYNNRLRGFERPYSQYLVEKHQNTWLVPE